MVAPPSHSTFKGAALVVDFTFITCSKQVLDSFPSASEFGREEYGIWNATP
jgi:hypothetical protein